jgi:hypothetical protein
MAHAGMRGNALLVAQNSAYTHQNKEKTMNKTLRNTLIVIAGLLVASGLFYGGMLVANRTSVLRSGMMGGYGNGGTIPSQGYGPGMMSGNGGMMGNGQGMMGGYGHGMMTGDLYLNSDNLELLSVDQATLAAESYLASLGNDDLKIAEIMIFDNNGYARITEISTGIGAFELLVDPTTKIAYPEYGPNMMWNLKYGAMNHQGMMGTMGWNWSSPTPSAVSADMPVTAEQARSNAQDYLDAYMAGATVAEDADPFYGYYTIDIFLGGEVTGMLSVNGFSGQVFVHTWHGKFVEMSEE